MLSPSYPFSTGTILRSHHFPSRPRHVLISVREVSCRKTSKSIVTISVLPISVHADGDRPIESLAVERCATNLGSTMLKNLMVRRESKMDSRNVLANARWATPNVARCWTVYVFSASFFLVSGCG